MGLALAVLLAAAPPPLPVRAAALLEPVGHEALGGRGLNAGLALAGGCAFVGSRGVGPVAIVDVADPARPRAVGEIPSRGNTTARELRALPDQHLLAVLSYALGAAGANRLDLYRWDAGCAQPAQLGAFTFQSGRPHEFFLWRGGPGGTRTLAFVSMFGTGGPELRVIDLSDPARPEQVGGWSPPSGILHSLSVDGGGRAYLALWTGGLAVADLSDFTEGRPGPQVRLLTPPGGFLAPPPGGNVHSAVPLPGTPFVMTTDERYPPACPFGPARLVDVSDPARPRAAAQLEAPENAPASCRQAPGGTYTSHNPTLLPGLALISWYSSGLQVFDLSDPERPQRIAEYRPRYGRPQAVDQQLGPSETMAWSYPIVRQGLIYLADINQGLVILRYSGPHEDEVARADQVEGNTYTAPPPPPPAPPATAAPPAPAASVPRRQRRPGGGPGDATPALLLLLGLGAVAAGLGLLAMRRRPPPPAG